MVDIVLTLPSFNSRSRTAVRVKGQYAHVTALIGTFLGTIRVILCPCSQWGHPWCLYHDLT